jgi:2'-5' RNA ligase
MMVDATLPGKSLDAQFEAMWQRFERLPYTTDTMGTWTARFQRYLKPINVSFIVPIEDQAICHYLGEAQMALMPHMYYEPQPPDKLHITLYQLGYLQTTGFHFPGTFSRAELASIANRAREYLALFKPFDVQIGPINAFPNVAIAEVHDQGRLRLLSNLIIQTVPRGLGVLPRYPLIPHITLGYFGRQPAPPVRNVIRPLRRMKPVIMQIDRVDMTLYYGKAGPYERPHALVHSHEEVIATLPIGG